jgi:PAS domain S-box-containing protein
VVETGHQKYLLNTAEDITERKKSEELLVESEQRYRSLFEESNDAIFLIDLTNGSYKDCNRLAEKLTGYTHEEILTMRIGSLLPPQRKSEAASNVEFILSHNVLRNETEIFTKDGEIVPVEFNSSKVEINQKQYILSMLHDISDRKAAEESLKQSEEALKKAQEIAHIGSWSLDLEKNQLTWSDEMYRIFGVPPLEFPATYEGFLDSVHPEDLDKVNTAYTNSILEGKETYEIDHRIIRKNSGEIRHILEKCEHVRDASGKIIGSVGMSHDITEQKQAEEALKQLNEVLEERILERTEELLDLNETLKITEEKYRTVADFTTNWEFWISPGDQMIYSSPSCERITGYSVADFVMNPQLLIDIIHPEDLPMYLEHKKQEKQTQACLHEIRFRIVRKDGSIRWIGHFCQPVFDESGQFRGIRGSNKDINARKKGEELLKKSNLKYSLLSANITDGIFIFRDGCFEYVNRAMNLIFGYQGAELIGLGLNQLILPEYANELDFLQTVPPMSQKRTVEIECIRKDQSVITVEFLFNYIAAENVIYGVAHDITEKKQIQKNIVKAIILTEEKERTYFSKELHDGLGPLLSTIKLYLEWSKEAGNKQSRIEIIGKAEEIIEDSIRTVKEISNKLSPHILINFGLCSAIQNFIDKLRDTSSIKFEFNCMIHRRMGNEIEAAIYRATIECINNTLKYSGAKNIIISLYEVDNQLQWHYLDDGVGFDLKETIAMKKGLGLFNLQNRIQNIGGKIKMFSKPGKGVEYRIVVNI